MLALVTLALLTAQAPPAAADVKVFTRNVAADLKQIARDLPDLNDSPRQSTSARYLLSNLWRNPAENPEHFPETEAAAIHKLMKSDRFKELLSPTYRIRLVDPKTKAERHRVTALGMYLQVENRPVGAYLSPKEKRSGRKINAAGRKKAIERISVWIKVPESLADQLDTESLVAAKSLTVSVRITDVEIQGIQRFHPYAHPPRLSRITCELQDVAPRFKKAAKDHAD